MNLSETKKNAIEIKNLGKKYDSFKDGESQYVLKNINLEIKENEFVCILGPSGCGKSTLLNLISGYIKPSEGTISIYDEIVDKPSSKFGMVFQEHALMPWLTVKNNILMGPKIKHKSKAECNEIAEKYIHMVGLDGMENYYPRQLSGGMAQRVGIARALANEPQILLMDEPLGALDAMTRENMRKELLKIFEKTKTTIVFITHSVQEAVYLADRVIVLKDTEVNCDVEIDITRPRNIRSKEFSQYIELFESKLGNIPLTSD